MSIYKGTTQLAGGFTEVDSVLSSVSTNPPQNKIVTERLAAFSPYIQYYGVSQMNTQETVNAADLLAATGDLHALNLDLSQNTVLKKLTAAGTSGSLANLSGVLVSPFAPLDSATSPQIDLSYSALNKTALVNLFNSMPYNVGYTVVGSPTIADGVISGFNDSNYATVPYPTTIPTKTECVINFTTGNSITEASNQNILNFVDFLNLEINTTGQLYTYDYTRKQRVGNANLATNTNYYCKILFENNQKTLSLSTDGVNYTTFADFNDAWYVSHSGIIYFGKHPSNANRYFVGSINFNNTYIKINDVPFFTGKAAMTKTCSVVGCTGTADLTQSDKDIALNKGWALTVA